MNDVISRRLGRLMSFTTQPQMSYLQYWVSLRHMRHTVMRIRACSDVYIAFIDEHQNGYEVTLGTNGT